MCERSGRREAIQELPSALGEEMLVGNVPCRQEQSSATRREQLSIEKKTSSLKVACLFWGLPAASPGMSVFPLSFPASIEEVPLMFEKMYKV